MKKSGNAWSFSKSQVWNACQKKYYYSYIKKYEHDDLADQVRDLQQYRSIYLTKGELIHQAIAEYIVNNQCGIKHSLEKDAESACEKIRKRYYEEPCLEKLNNVQITDETIDAVLKGVRSCLHTFQTRFWPALSSYTYKGIEKSIYFNLDEWQVTGKIDYIAEKENGVVVIDWKSGSRTQDDASQALIYCMCVMHDTGLSEENVSAEVAYLSDGKKGCVKPTANKVKAMEARIVRECEEMSVLNSEPEGNPNDNCIFCQYYTICKDHLDVNISEKVVEDSFSEL